MLKLPEAEEVPHVQGSAFELGRDDQELDECLFASRLIHAERRVFCIHDEQSH